MQCNNNNATSGPRVGADYSSMIMIMITPSLFQMITIMITGKINNFDYNYDYVCMITLLTCADYYYVNSYHESGRMTY